MLRAAALALIVITNLLQPSLGCTILELTGAFTFMQARLVRIASGCAVEGPGIACRHPILTRRAFVVQIYFGTRSSTCLSTPEGCVKVLNDGTSMEHISVAMQMKGSPGMSCGCCTDTACILQQMGPFTWMPPSGHSSAQTQVRLEQQLLATWASRSGLHPGQ